MIVCAECGQVKEHQNHWAPFGWHNFVSPEPKCTRCGVERSIHSIEPPYDTADCPGFSYVKGDKK